MQLPVGKADKSSAEVSFFHEDDVETEILSYGNGVPLGVKRIFNDQLGMGGAFGTWGKAYENTSLPGLVEDYLGRPLLPADRIDPAPLGFRSRHHIQSLDPNQHTAVEIEAGARFLQAATEANGWRPEEVEGVLIGNSLPVADDYTSRIAHAAGIPESALKVSVHKACDGSVGALHLLLNPELEINQRGEINIAEELRGKKVLVGGIEGLSRFVRESKDQFALQIFGNGAGVIGLQPEHNLQFLAGSAREVFDEAGVLQLRMFYPHSGRHGEGGSLLEVSRAGPNHIRVAGRMNEPEGGIPIRMASPMGMVKLFVRTGVEFVRDFYAEYIDRVGAKGEERDEFAAVIVHHANLRINRLKEKHLRRNGLPFSLRWVVSEFGNVSAASNMIAFLRHLPDLKAADRILIYGFGAGTYYDALAVQFP